MVRLALPVVLFTVGVSGMAPFLSLGAATIQEESPAIVGIYCRLSGQEYSDREVTMRRVLAKSSEVMETEQGVRFRFASSSKVAHELLDLIEAERECCPFLTFALEFGENDGPIELAVSGPPEAKSAILAGFGKATTSQ